MEAYQFRTHFISINFNRVRYLQDINKIDLIFVATKLLIFHC